jgi:flagellar biogenesis protein FliO
MDTSLDLGLQLAKMVGGLAIVLVVLLACVHGLKKTGLWIKQPHPGAVIRILAQQTIGLKHQLVVLAVQDQTFLVGVSPQGINLLTHLRGTAEKSSPADDSIHEEGR